MGKKKIIINPPGVNQTPTRNLERECKKNPLDPSFMASFPQLSRLDCISLNHPQLTPSCALYTLKEYPGLLILKGALTREAQSEWVVSSLRDLTKLPNVTNLHTHYLVPPTGLWKSFIETPMEFLEFKNEFDNHSVDLYEESVDGSEKSIEKKTHDNNENAKVDSHANIENPKTLDKPLDQIKIDPPTSDRPYMKSILYKDAIKKLRWASLGFQYHWITKEYHLDRRVSMPCSITSITNALVESLEPWTEYPLSEWKAESGIINFYQYKDSLTSHQDRSELNTRAPLISMSIGCKAIFLMGTESRLDKPTPILLESGDIMILSGKNFHGLPRILEGTCPLYLKDLLPIEFYNYIEHARVNVNLRQVF